MRLVILEAESLGKDMDLSGFSRFGEVTVYEKTTEEECPERVREADIVICNKVRMCSPRKGRQPSRSGLSHCR